MNKVKVKDEDNVGAVGSRFVLVESARATQMEAYDQLPRMFRELVDVLTVKVHCSDVLKTYREAQSDPDEIILLEFIRFALGQGMIELNDAKKLWSKWCS